MNLSSLFKAVAGKNLSAVDADPTSSHQHEIGGLSALKRIWGNVESNTAIPCTYIYASDSILFKEMGSITWYNARQNVSHRGPEWRIYYQDNEITELMKPNDFLVITECNDGSVFFIVGNHDSNAENQIKQLFNIREVRSRGFTIIDTNTDDTELGLISRLILDNLEIEFDYSDDNYLDELIQKFGNKFPKTKVFSEFARNQIHAEEYHSMDDLLLAWMDKEEILFRTFEKHFVEKELKKGFSSVDDFISYSLSVHNRRKSRAGHAFENHLCEIFSYNNLLFVNGETTEGKKKPDFLFPSIESYHSADFPVELLTMLGAKTSCKDRWRQVLTEANRIPKKHLITLEPSISNDQLSEMEASMLRLVIPSSIQLTYPDKSRNMLFSLDDFIDFLRSKQVRYPV